MPRPYGYVNAEYLKRAAERMRDIKERSYELMHPAQAERLLDAGCGPGVDTVELALMTRGQVEVTGVDIDEQMIAEADAHAKAHKVDHIVTHVLADVYDLPFPDEHFNACRAERLFQNIPVSHEPEAVLDELIRVLVDGGRIVLVDTDFSSASVDFDDVNLERKMASYCALRFRPNGLAARRFYRMLKEAEMGDVHAESHPMVLNALEDSPFGKFLVNAALRDAYITEEEARHWMDTLADVSSNGKFHATLNVQIVTGTKTSSPKPA